LRILFTRCRERRLTLSAAKSQFFVTEATFAGGRVRPDGIKPDLTKLTAVIDWETPRDLQNLGAFLGLTGYFRNLIKGYAKIAQPLSDLVKAAEIPRKRGKGMYRCALCGHTLEKLWGPKEQRAFLSLKIALTQEPVLKGPKFDGTPSIVTTDGSKFGFAGMLSQWHTTVDVDGKTTRRLHPVGFASKGTSSSEEWYKPLKRWTRVRPCNLMKSTRE
jgi:hypothetical protein